MTKLERINEDINKMKSKTTEFQARLRDLERQKSELEDNEILQLIHGYKMTKEDLTALFKNKNR